MVGADFVGNVMKIYAAQASFVDACIFNQAKFLLLILLLSFSPVCFADYIFQGVRTICSKNSFEVFAINWTGEKPSYDVDVIVEGEGKGKAFYLGTKRHVVSCQVGKHKVKTEFFTEESRERGACGGEPGSQVAFWVDDTQVQGYNLFNNYCFESLNEISFFQSKGAYVLRVCGHKGRGVGEYKNGCFNLKENQFRLLANPFPFSSLIENNALQMIPDEDSE
jgi:hypothetical protein